ncbi:uncharacterized protein B0H18DRAFT_979700 [Fomitopsis serialis]|uniref:uncharacterized protein n=1 Tax=Fomitopsis serialis TaxID=139415 RepID=UPI0020081CFE|nr:uncharacterized protein B0H18DRAFT_979700 [Neoantrodia serialis]KAH9934152.1 hypothetical protein B0H18DRAFT_979700 [Neoantrodia serialis]
MAASSSFTPPRKVILLKEQLEHFQASQAHQDIVAYIQTLNDAVVGVKLADECSESPGVKAVLGVLDGVEEIARATPPVDNKASRFGNPAFRTFYDKVQELAVYFGEAWGNRTRIDYGSGMELNFLCCRADSDHVALVIRVFWRYVQVMRVLQSTYWLEPAGSHGVWGLDDYHFLPFLFGSAQLRGHKYIKPKSIHDADIVDEYSKYYMYFACIKFINSVKSASLRWHSPMLDDISAVKTWDKVNSGMIKMYLAEVLGKLPRAGQDDDAHCGHDHAHADMGGAGQREVGWGDCCGIPVPSVFGAAAAEKGKGLPGAGLGGPGVRAVPLTEEDAESTALLPPAF